jgi:hypothetical protein
MLNELVEAKDQFLVSDTSELPCSRSTVEPDLLFWSARVRNVS